VAKGSAAATVSKTGSAKPPPGVVVLALVLCATTITWAARAMGRPEDPVPTTWILWVPARARRGTTMLVLNVPSPRASAEPTTTRLGVSSTILTLLPASKPEPESLISAPASTFSGVEIAGVATMAAGAGRVVPWVVAGATVVAAAAVVVVADEAVELAGAVVVEGLASTLGGLVPDVVGLAVSVLVVAAGAAVVAEGAFVVLVVVEGWELLARLATVAVVEAPGWVAGTGVVPLAGDCAGDVVVAAVVVVLEGGGVGWGKGTGGSVVVVVVEEELVGTVVDGLVVGAVVVLAGAPVVVVVEVGRLVEVVVEVVVDRSAVVDEVGALVDVLVGVLVGALVGVVAGVVAVVVAAAGGTVVTAGAVVGGSAPAPPAAIMEMPSTTVATRLAPKRLSPRSGLLGVSGIPAPELACGTGGKARPTAEGIIQAPHVLSRRAVAAPGLSVLAVAGGGHSRPDWSGGRAS